MNVDLSMPHELKFIDYGSEEYYQAAHLRYRIFYRDRGVDFISLIGETERAGHHAAIVTASLGVGEASLTGNRIRVLAYGRLSSMSSTQLAISQLVVELRLQGCGLGSRIMQALIDRALAEGTIEIFLNARLPKVGFYQKFDFETVGDVFRSAITGEPHIKMRRRL